MRIYDSVVKCTMRYGANKMNKQVRNKIQATEMDSLRTNCRVSHSDRITNEEINQRMGVEKVMIEYIDETRLIWFGHARRANPTDD